MRDAAMLLLLRRPLWDAVMFCAFDKVRKPDGSREVPPGTTNALRTEGKTGAQIEKESLMCAAGVSYSEKTACWLQYC
jgi:hypothetical protein